MNTYDSNPISPEIIAAMEEAAQFALTGKGNAEVLQRIHLEAERIRQEVFHKHGTLDIGVPAIRELRDSE